MLEAAYIL